MSNPEAKSKTPTNLASAFEYLDDMLALGITDLILFWLLQEKFKISEDEARQIMSQWQQRTTLRGASNNA